MSREKTKLLARIRRIQGQLEAVTRSVEGESPCTETLQLVASARGALNGLMGELVEDHIREHIVEASGSKQQVADGAQELIEVLRTYMK